MYYIYIVIFSKQDKQIPYQLYVYLFVVPTNDRRTIPTIYVTAPFDLKQDQRSKA